MSATATVTAIEPKSRPAITAALAHFAAGLRYEDLPPEVAAGSKRSILDTVGVMLGGCAEEAPRILGRYAARYGAGAATVVGQGFRAQPPLAALVNGTAADVFGFSDIVVLNMNHPSGSLCSALLALGQELGSSGRDIIAAHVIGVEVADKISVGVKPGLQLKGWHPLAVLNTFGVAAACGRLLGFDAGQMANAFGIAGVMASGIRAGMGTMSKAFGAGRAARDGMEAALLTRDGFTGPRDVMETRDGFLQTFGDGVDGAAILDGLGRSFAYVDPGMTYKAYPTCTRSHPGISAVLKLRAQHGIVPDEVESILCEVTPAVADYLKFDVAQTLFQAKYSLPFCVALALVDGRVTLSNVTEEKVREGAIVSLMQKTRMVIGADFAQHGYIPAYAPHGCRVRIRLRDGRELVAQENRGPWEPATPPTWEALMEKYRGCAEIVLDAAAIRASADIIRDLEAASNIGELMTVLERGRVADRPCASPDSASSSDRGLS